MKSPFKFLDAYTIEDRDIFFGRSQEVNELYNMAFQSSLMLVYGLSGTGKTSLIQCGLAARFDNADWNPFFIRRRGNINESLNRMLTQALPENTSVGEKPSDKVAYLFRYFLRPVYLVFDQFEELFILGDKAEQETFGRAIQDIIDQELPCKIFLIMREEFIAQLYGLEKFLPTLYDHRLRVEPMNFSKIQEVLLKSFERFNIRLSNPKADTELIYKNVSAGKFGVQLPYLQVYLDLLYREDLAQTYPELKETPAELPEITFTTDEIESFGHIEGVLGRFLAERTKAIQKELAADFPQLPKDILHYVLDAFVTAEGTKRPLSFTLKEDFIELDSKAPEFLRQLSPPLRTACLQALENNRILYRREDAYELAHDSLAALIEEQRSEEQRQLKEATLLVREGYNDFQQTRRRLSEKQLESVEGFLEEMQLSPAERKFVTASQKAVVGRKRRRNSAIIISAFTILIILLGLLWRSQIQAKNSRDDARRQEGIALANVAIDSIYLFEVLPAFEKPETESDNRSVNRDEYTPEQREAQLNALNSLLERYQFYRDSLALPLPYIAADAYKRRAFLHGERDSIALGLQDLDSLQNAFQSGSDSILFNNWRNAYLGQFRRDTVQSGDLTITPVFANGYKTGDEVSEGEKKVFFEKYRSGYKYGGTKNLNQRWDFLSGFLEELKISESSRSVIIAALPNEASFEGINAWDATFFNFGIYQWNLGTRANQGELPALLKKIKTFYPEAFRQYFGKYGIDFSEETTAVNGYLTLNGELIDAAAKKEIFRAPEWLFPFWLAAQDPKIQAVQLEHAISRLDRFYWSFKVYGFTLNQIITSEYGVALLLDNHVNLPALVQKALKAAMDETGLKDPTNWGTEEERRVLEAYIKARARNLDGVGPMSDAEGRAQATYSYVKKGIISDQRGSFRM